MLKHLTYKNVFRKVNQWLELDPIIALNPYQQVNWTWNEHHCLDHDYTICVGDLYETDSRWQDCQPGRYTACIYDFNWYIGNIADRSDEHFDVLVSFMKRQCPLVASSFKEGWMPRQHVLCLVDAPNVQGRGAHHYTLSQDDQHKVWSLLPQVLNQWNFINAENLSNWNIVYNVLRDVLTSYSIS